MTRILQIRRGTAAQNNSFTGLNGEITMDTTNKTLRVHDGSTAGGIALAKQSELPSAFDITSVSSSFWTNLFSTYQTNKTFQSESSDLAAVVSSIYTEYEFSYDNMPVFAEAVLVCQSPEAGYSIADEVRAFGIGNDAYPRLNTYVANGHLNVRLFVNEQSFWVFHKTDATKTNITNANWKIKFIVYY